MQKLSDIFEKLTTGELSQVHLGGAEAGHISEANYRAVAQHIQLGLTALYNRFELKRSQLTLKLFPDQTDYRLHSRYARNGKGSTEPRRWILDTSSAPYGNDIIKILAVNTDTGNPMPLNDYSDEYSIMTPTLESIRVPKSIANPLALVTPGELITKNLIVEYRANHPNLQDLTNFVYVDGGFFTPASLTAPSLELKDVMVELPDTHVQALLYFVASRVHNPIGMGQEFNAGNNWAARFESECQRLENEGNEIDTGGTNTRAKRGGWI